MKKHTILCVDDEIDNVDALERLFRSKFTVLKATSAAAALELLDQNKGKVSVLITDQRMPQMTGVELLEKTLVSHPDLIRILLTGYTDIESIISAVNKGQIYRYITKPWDPVDLTNTVVHAAERFYVGQELKQKTKALEDALVELKALDKAKSDFMILVNHELKTPLTGILSFLSLLSETKLDEEQNLMVDRTLRNANRLRALIEDVLLLMQSESNQLKLKIESVIMEDLLVDMPSSITATLNQKNQKLLIKGIYKPVLADATILRQVLIRILHNACKYGLENSDILLETQDLGNKVRMVIQNYGPQISNAVIEKIFSPFVTKENMMNHSAGLGIGLPICQSLLKLQNSFINIKNTDQGVMVYFEVFR